MPIGPKIHEKKVKKSADNGNDNWRKLPRVDGKNGDFVSHPKVFLILADHWDMMSKKKWKNIWKMKRKQPQIFAD